MADCGSKVISMVADRTCMNRELDTLISQQIHTLKQDAKISESELTEYQQRSQRIRILCRTLDRTSAEIWANTHAKPAGPLFNLS